MKNFPLFLILILLISCNTDKSVVSEEKEYIDLSSYFPLQIGNTWIYEMESSQWATMQRTIVDTIRNDEGQLFYKAMWGVEGYPPDSYTFEYYNWYNSGLNKYSCGIEDTCSSPSGDTYPPYQELIIKSPIYEGGTWSRGPEWLTNERIYEFNLIDSLSLYNEVGSTIIDTTFYDVAIISKIGISNEDTTKVFEYYAPNFGLIKEFTMIGADTTYLLNLLEYQNLND